MHSLVRYVLHTVEIALCQATRVLPIKKNRIVCDSVNSVSQFADSPKYIVEHLLDTRPARYEIVWLSDDVDRLSVLEERGIKVVRRHSLRDIYYSNTAAVFIGNLFGAPPYVARRRGRLVVETTHGVAYKSLLSGVFGESGTSKELKWERRFCSRRINRCDLCLSGSRITSEAVYRRELGYKGRIVECGLPRNDVFFRDMAKQREGVRNRLGLDSEERIVLVMPTWRKNQDRKNVELDYRSLVRSLGESYGGSWRALLRLHPLTSFDYSDILASHSECLMDVTTGFESQELLCVADLLVTDYSSVVWDFALLGRPILLFQPDLGDYEAERGFNVPPSEWMLPTAQSPEELVGLVRHSSYEALCERSQRHLERFGSYETGHATETVCEIIDEHATARPEVLKDRRSALRVDGRSR